MWKDSYRIGVEKIDRQHEELFELVEKLVQDLEASKPWEPKQKFIVALAFIKRCGAEHFQSEEEYMRAIHYPGYEEHKKEHEEFTNTVLDYEKKFHDSGYDLQHVREFSGYLVTWLLYHVVENDRRIVETERSPEPDLEAASYLECFAKSISYVFETMFGIITSDITPVQEYQNIGSIHSTIEFIGEFKGEVVYSFPTDFAFRLMKIMTGMELNEVDDILRSAMAEISNIVSGNASIELSKKGHACDIRPPMIRSGPFQHNTNFPNAQCMAVNTPLGSLFITIEK